MAAQRAEEILLTVGMKIPMDSRNGLFLVREEPRTDASVRHVLSFVKEWSVEHMVVSRGGGGMHVFMASSFTC